MADRLLLTSICFLVVYCFSRLCSDLPNKRMNMSMSSLKETLNCRQNEQLGIQFDGQWV